MKARWKRSLAIALSAAMVFSLFGVPVYATGERGTPKGTLCEHHKEHDDACGYWEGTPCGHEHGEECFVLVENCVHTHTVDCYPEIGEDDGGDGSDENGGEGTLATSSNVAGGTPYGCTHACGEDTGCITKKLNCGHEHDEDCGYTEAAPCAFVCEDCGKEKDESQQKTQNSGGIRSITNWEWLDEEGALVLDEEGDGWTLALAGVNEDNQADFDTVVSMLPEKVSAAMGTEEPEEIVLSGWICTAYRKERDGNWPYAGNYTFSGNLPEGYVLSGQAKPLEVTVKLGGAALLSDAEEYSEADIDVINKIIENNGLKAEKDNPKGWESSDLAYWNDETPKRITTLNIYNEGLTGELDVSGLAELEILDCSFNRLNALNVSGLKKLGNINCSLNQLETLCIDNLEPFRLGHLFISNNPFQSITIEDHTLTMEPAENGTIWTTDFDMRTNKITLEARAEEWYVFQKWANLPDSLLEGDRNSSAITFTLDKDITVAASYEKLVPAESDIAVINTIIERNGLDARKDDLEGWKSSGLVQWNNDNPGRIRRLSLAERSLTGELDVRGLTNLEYLDCNSNELEALRVEGLTNLEVLDCYGNELEALCVDGLTNLKELRCYGNELETLRVEGLMNLEGLYCYSNQLKTLRVDDLENLENLNCSSNQLEALDVSGLKNLKTLLCSFNPLQSLTMAEDITLTIEPDVGGWINISSISLSPTKIITLMVQPNVGYSFLEWVQKPEFAEEYVDGLVLRFPLENSVTVAAKYGKAQMSDDDIAVINSIIEKNGLDAPKDNPKAWEDSELVQWNRETPQRIVGLQLENQGLRGTLDVRGLTQLNELNCANNQLSALDVSENPAIQYISCANNPLQTLKTTTGTLTITLDGGGLVMIKDFNLETGEVLLEAIPDSDSPFKGWGKVPEGGVIEGNTLRFTLKKDVLLTPEFTPAGGADGGDTPGGDTEGETPGGSTGGNTGGTTSGVKRPSGAGSRPAGTGVWSNGSAPGPGTWPSYTVSGTWTMEADGAWTFTDRNGVVYKNTWAAVYNPYADSANGQNPIDWFYFGPDGHMLTGWQKIDGRWYYFNEVSDGTRGAMMTDTWIGAYYVDRDGVWKEDRI